MKTAALITCVCATLVVLPRVRAFTEFGRGELLLSTSGSATYDSRVLGGVSNADDVIFTLFPQLIYKREAAQMKLDAHAGVRLNRYYDFSEFNSDDLTTGLNLRLPPDVAPRFSGNFRVNYDERSDVNYDVNRRIRDKTFSTRLDTSIVTGLKTSVDLLGSYLDAERNIFSDRRQWEGGAGFNYRDFLGGTDLGLRYRHLDNETSGDNALGIPLNQRSDTYTLNVSRPIYADVRGTISYGYRTLHRSRIETITGQTDFSGAVFSVGIDGPFLPRSRFPKLESSLSLAYENSEVPGINYSNTRRLAGSARVAWAARPETHLSISLRRAMELSINDITVDSTSASVGVTQAIGHFVDASGFVGYDRRVYRGFTRDDDVIFFEGRLTYRVTKYWSASGDYRYRSSSSTLASADYDRHLVSGVVTFTF